MKLSLIYLSINHLERVKLRPLVKPKNPEPINQTSKESISPKYSEENKEVSLSVIKIDDLIVNSSDVVLNKKEPEIKSSKLDLPGDV